MMKKYILKQLLLVMAIGLLTSLLYSKKSHAQDPHFSQNYATPLFLNPAMTGLMAGDFRAAVVYRNQWANALPGAAFRTITASVDAALPGISDNDRVALGVMLYNDQAGSLNWSTNYIDAALAYNVGFSETAYLSLGFEGGITQKSVNLDNAQFGDQYDETSGGPTSEPSADLINLPNTSQLHANLAGGAVLYIAPSPRSNMYIGGGMYHFLRPDIKSSNISERAQLSAKISAQAGGSFPVGKSLDIVPSAYFINQDGASKIDAGSFLRFIFSTNRYTGLDKAFNIGTWARLTSSVEGMDMSALVFAAKVDYASVSLGLSYDWALGDLGTAIDGRGGIEVALVFNTQIREEKKELYCPRF